MNEHLRHLTSDLSLRECGLGVPRRSCCWTASTSIGQDGDRSRLSVWSQCDPAAGRANLCVCGSTRDIGVVHINGHEEDNEPANLAWSCRSCNGKMAHAFRRAGLGRRVAQYNPSRDAQSLGAWMAAVESMRGETDQMSVADAVALIRATPDWQRSAFAQEIWSPRRERGTDRTGVPF